MAWASHSLLVSGNSTSYMEASYMEVSKRKKVGPLAIATIGTGTSALLPGYSLVKAVKEPTWVQEGGKINPIYATGSHCRRDKDIMWGGKYYCSHLWRRQFVTSEAISVIQAITDDGLDWGGCT